EVRNTVGSAIHLNGHHFELLNMSVHDNGLVSQQMGYANGANGVYGMASNSVVRGGVFHDNLCFGVRFFTSYPSGTGHDNLVTGATFYNNGAGKAFGGISACSSGGGGVVMGDTDNVASNNIMHDNVKGIWLYKSPTATNNNAVYNNTIYNNTYGIIIDNTDVTNSIIKNNLVVGNTRSNYIDEGSGTIAANNRITGLITDCTISTVNFRLKAGAPCIDAGATIATVTSDFAGIPRPQGAAHDIGAYEMSGTDTAGPMAPRGLTVQ
ncbi:MAG: choice-of-anchor Q domain-containing protein, partial [Nitrospiraceae bacterium]